MKISYSYESLMNAKRVRMFYYLVVCMVPFLTASGCRKPIGGTNGIVFIRPEATSTEITNYLLSETVQDSTRGISIFSVDVSDNCLSALKNCRYLKDFNMTGNYKVTNPFLLKTLFAMISIKNISIYEYDLRNQSLHLEPYSKVQILSLHNSSIDIGLIVQFINLDGDFFIFDSIDSNSRVFDGDKELTMQETFDRLPTEAADKYRIRFSDKHHDLNLKKIETHQQTSRVEKIVGDEGSDPVFGL